MRLIKENHPGQVALVMVLIMTVVSAVAVSVASRSTVETRTQTMDIESNEAMLAAQAGLEQAASVGVGVSGTLETGKNYSVTVDTTGANGVASDKLNPGETLDVNLSGATALSGARIYWKPAVVGDTPSIFVSDIRTDRIIDYAYDSTGSNGFTRVSTGGNLNGVSYTYMIPAAITTSLATSKSLRITVLGAAAFVGVEPVGGLFPAQTRTYRSIGDVGMGETKIKYGIQYDESTTDKIPGVFDYALFANGSIIQ